MAQHLNGISEIRSFFRTNTQPIFDPRSENGVSYVVSVTPIVSAGSKQANFFQSPRSRIRWIC